MCSIVLVLLASFLGIISSVEAQNIVKRQASDGELYVYSTMGECAAVQSQNPCPVDWLLPDFFAKMYKGQNKIIATKLRLMFNGDSMNTNCTKAATKALCSQVTPKCLPKSPKIEFADTNPVCEKVRQFCPRYVTTDVCSEGLLTGVQTETKCVFPKKPMEGACAQPKYKMPFTILHSYEQVSRDFKDLFTNLAKLPSDHKLFSQECLTNIKEMFCVDLVCSADEKRLLIKHDIGDCRRIVNKCFKNTRKFFFSPLNVIVNNMKDLLTAQCKIYPERNQTKTESAPPIMKQSSSATAISSSIFTVLFLVTTFLPNK